MRESYLLNGEMIEVMSAAGQLALAKAHQASTRILCPCCSPAPKMYIAAVGDKFIVKRMPDTGMGHAPDCPSFEPPEELSGLGAIRRDAVQEDRSEGTITLKLDFPLKQYGKRKAPPEASGQPAQEAHSKPQKMKLTSLLHYLWHESDLVKWYPRMEGKRWWGNVGHALTSTADGLQAKGKPLGDVLYVPEAFRVEDKAELAAKRRQLFARLSNAKGSGTQLGLVRGVYKRHEETSMGAKLSLRHAPDCAFFMDRDLAKRFETVFAERLQLATFLPGTHVLLIATFSVAKAGYPVLQDIGMMLASQNWIPFEHMRELELIHKLSEEKRAFQKSLRFNLDQSTRFASAITLDTPDPIALFVSEQEDNAEECAKLREAGDELKLPCWYWTQDAMIPELPERGRR